MTSGPTFSASETVRSALAKLTAAFASAGIVSAPNDARFLLQGILQLDGAALIRDPDAQLGVRAELVSLAAARRLTHEPVSRILGQREFYGRNFRVTADVLDPRADTETLVDLVLDTVRAEGRQNHALRIADIGTGSGAIIITLLAELPNATGIATDVSTAALAVTKANAEALGVIDRLTLVKTRGLQAVNDPIDLVVSNPPYIATAAIAGLDVDVRDFDPHLALDGGFDGLNVYREIANDISNMKRDAWLFLEIGANQEALINAVFSEHGFAFRHCRVDLGGHIRAVAFEHLR